MMMMIIIRIMNCDYWNDRLVTCKKVKPSWQKHTGFPCSKRQPWQSSSNYANHLNHDENHLLAITKPPTAGFLPSLLTAFRKLSNPSVYHHHHHHHHHHNNHHHHHHHHHQHHHHHHHHPCIIITITDLPSEQKSEETWSFVNWWPARHLYRT